MLVGVVTAGARARCQERIADLSASTLSCDSIQREAVAELQSVIGFDRWCSLLADPETLIPLGGIAEHDYGPRVARALALEYSGEDFLAKPALGRRSYPAAGLSAETSRDLARSARWDEVLRPVGIGDVAAVACRDALGCWGWIYAYRDIGDKPFDEDEVQLLAAVSASLGSAIRRHVLQVSESTALEPRAPGVLVLDRDLKLISWTTAARAWIDALPLATLFAAWEMLPAVVYPIAVLARTQETAAGAHALERTVDGCWVKIEATPLHGHGEGEIAVTLRGAAAPETFHLFCRAYALSRRERDVVAAVVAGLGTRAISGSLFISPHTVQDHLKSVFAKVRVHSRRELLSKFGASLNSTRAKT
jgi:DNA-binding CsgD family transcriptional regulator